VTVYTLFSQAATGSSIAGDNTAYTMGVQFSVSTAGCTLTGIWFYSAAGAGVLPATIALFQVSGGSLVTSQAASWGGASAGAGWVRQGFTSPPSLTSGTQYVACVYVDPAGSNWYSLTGAYWSSGAGSGGVTNGPLSAPNNAGAANGQDVFNSGIGLTFPATSFNASNYWVDPEVTTSAGPPPAAVQVANPEAAGVSGWVMLPVRGRVGSAV